MNYMTKQVMHNKALVRMQTMLRFVCAVQFGHHPYKELYEEVNIER